MFHIRTDVNYKNADKLKIGQTIILESKFLPQEMVKQLKTHAAKLHFDQSKSLPDLIKTSGVTALDRCLVNKDLQSLLSNNGVGAEIKAALKERRQILVSMVLARVIDGKITVNKNLFDDLKKQELDHYKGKLRKDGFYVYDELPKSFIRNLKDRVKLSGMDYGLIEGKQKNLAIIPINNKEFMQLQGKDVSVGYKVMDRGLPKFIIKPIGKELTIL